MSDIAIEDFESTPLVELALSTPLTVDASDWPSGSHVPPHHHNVDQLIYAATGVLTVQTKQGVWVVPPTRAVWVPAYTNHSIKNSGKVQLRTLQFNTGASPIPHDSCCVVQVSSLLRAAILRILKFSGNYQDNTAESRVVTVALDEIATAKGTPLHLPMPVDPRARRVAEAIRLDPSCRKSCKAWASETGVSERTLECLFSAETGTSFGKWQQQARLLKALEILASGQSVTTTAYDVGFKSPSAFIAMFKSAMGDTPSSYFAS